jgi:hypothetical protein
MRNLSRPFLAPTLAAVLLGFASSPLNAARRIAGSPYDGTLMWRSTPYAGTAGPFAPPCGSSVAAFIPRTKATKRVAASALTA